VNINNNTAEESDYVLAAMALSKVPYPDADSVALNYLSKAEDLNVNPVLTLCKQKDLEDKLLFAKMTLILFTFNYESFEFNRGNSQHR
jgi:hypothetical protein